MKNIKEYPFEKARKILTSEVQAGRKAIEASLGQKRKVRPGRPPKKSGDKFIAVSIRLHPNVLRWAKTQAKKQHIGYQSLINQVLLAKVS